VAAARAKAVVLAEAAELSLGSVSRIEEEDGGTVGPLPRFGAMAMEARAADVPTEVATGDLTVTRRIRAWFEIG
jgi:uncharacterized protein YggE